VVNDSADVTSSGREVVPRLQAGNRKSSATNSRQSAQLVGTTRRLVPTEHSDCRLGRSTTRVNGPRYPGASPYSARVT